MLCASGVFMVWIMVVTNTWDAQNLLIPISGLCVVIGFSLAVLLFIVGLLTGGLKKPKLALAACAWPIVNVAVLFVLNAALKWQYDLNFGPS